jgi:hypothetical protein
MTAAALFKSTATLLRMGRGKDGAAPPGGADGAAVAGGAGVNPAGGPPKPLRRKSSKGKKGMAAAGGAGGGANPAHAVAPHGNWLRLISILLDGGVKAARRLTAGVSVFVHCSDGWDRTAGLTALAQLMVDPYYRTLEGFCLLVEKEWCAFGHRFARRCGTGGADHDRADHADTQRSPIFVQWVDAVWQMWRQQPGCFEFNDRLLVALAEHAYSGRFGTFLFDNERERCVRHVPAGTVSLWSYVLHPDYRASFTNPRFAAAAAAAAAAAPAVDAGTVAVAAADGGALAPAARSPVVFPRTDVGGLAVWPYWACKWA